VAGIGRNDPCPCGSLHKAKRCCGVRRGPSDDSLAQAFLASAARDAAPDLVSLSDAELHDLFDELWFLPVVDLALQASLPKLLSPDLQRLADTVKSRDPDEALLVSVAEQFDTPAERARLARAVLAATEAGQIDRQLAAAALIELASDSRMMLRASVLQAVAVRAGLARTPGGLRLAA
jgi:SEC-C motif-containing protein